MAITRFGARSIKGQSRFRGNPKSALQIKPVPPPKQGWGCSPGRTLSAYNAPPTATFARKKLVNSRRASLIIPATSLTLDSLCPRCWKCKSGA